MLISRGLQVEDDMRNWSKNLQKRLIESTEDRFKKIEKLEESFSTDTDDLSVSLLEPLQCVMKRYTLKHWLMNDGSQVREETNDSKQTQLLMSRAIDHSGLLRSVSLKDKRPFLMMKAEGLMNERLIPPHRYATETLTRGSETIHSASFSLIYFSKRSDFLRR